MKNSKSLRKTIRFDEKTINGLDIILKKYNIDTYSEGVRFLVNHFNDNKLFLNMYGTIKKIGIDRDKGDLRRDYE